MFDILLVANTPLENQIVASLIIAGFFLVTSRNLILAALGALCGIIAFCI